VKQALAKILRSKTFDNGTVCASEQSIIVERDMEQAVVREAERMGFYFMKPEEAERLAGKLFKPNGGLNPAVVGKDATVLAKMAGFSLPFGAKVLVARESKVGPDRPYSMEKLCPVLAFYVEDGEKEVLKRSMEILHHEGRGHTFSIHAEDKDVVRRFAKGTAILKERIALPTRLTVSPDFIKDVRKVVRIRTPVERKRNFNGASEDFAAILKRASKILPGCTEKMLS
jgi:acyl-CoA reductase-like NAD-dependent aldehyde dehydrogenase